MLSNSLQNVIDSHLYNIIIKDLEKSKYSEEPKTLLVRPIFEKNKRNKIGNYRPLSFLNGTSKIYEKCIHNSLFSYAETILSSFKSCLIKTYRKLEKIARQKKFCGYCSYRSLQKVLL